VQLAADLACFNLDEAVAVSFHEERRWEEEQRFMYDVFQRGRHLIILTGPHQHPNEAAVYLIAQGVDPQTEALVGECLTLPDG
jgi:precorrin-6B methylase 1